MKSKRAQRGAVKTPLTNEQLQRSKLLASEELKNNPNYYNLPSQNRRTTEDIVNFFIKAEMGQSQRILPPEKSRFVIYLRKSTDDEAKQVRSIEDQKVECLSLAKQLGVSVASEDIIEERLSASKSNNRPLFNAMLAGFQTGKYHGLIAWSPDRLSRNMKEAGEIIEMIDNEQIQHLHFNTYSFDNTPNGKMMLGILFATSKQYSDKLSVDVKRGVMGNVKDGKYTGIVKRGYYADSTTGYFMPDAHNWQLLRHAVVMRLKGGKTNQEVADYLNNAHFSYRKNEKDNYKLVKITKKNVSNMFSDPFYCGVYKFGNNVANLNELYNFLPLMTPDEFIALGRNISDNFSEEFKGRSTSSKRLDFGLLREKVICDYCDKIMVFQRTKLKKGKNAGSWLISFYCRNKDCIRHNDQEAIKKYGHKLSKSIRAKYVTAGIEWTLRHLTNNTVKAYRLYIDRLKQKLAVDKEIAKRKLRDAQNALKKSCDLYNKYRELQVNNPDAYNQHHKGALEKYKDLIDAHASSIAKAKGELVKLNESLPTKEEFVELVNSYLKTILSTKDLVEEDLVYQEVVLNLRAGDNTISVINLNPPYDLMVDLSKMPLG